MTKRMLVPSSGQASHFEVTQELRAIFIERIRRSFDRAHQCMTFARIARLKGDKAGADRWLWCVRALRTAAARWRIKARRVAPALMCLLWLAGCATPPPVTGDGRTIPYKVVRAVCTSHHEARWTGHAEALVDLEGHIGGLECTYTLRGAQYLRDIRSSSPAGRPLAEFLQKPVPR